MTHACGKANKVMTGSAWAFTGNITHVQKCHDHEEQTESDENGYCQCQHGTVQWGWSGCVCVGVSYIGWWKGSVVWSMSTSQSGCVLMCRRGSGWLCRGEGGGGHSSAHSTHSTCQLNRWWQTRSAACTHKHGRMDCLHHIVIPMSTCAHKETHMRNNTWQGYTCHIHTHTVDAQMSSFPWPL